MIYKCEKCGKLLSKKRPKWTHACAFELADKVTFQNKNGRKRKTATDKKYERLIDKIIG